MFDEEIQQYRAGRDFDAKIRRRLSGTYGLELNSSNSKRFYSKRTLLNPKANKKVNIFEGVKGSLFHDIYEIASNFLMDDGNIKTFIQATYINKKGSIATPTDEQASVNTSETTRGTASIDDRISQNNPIVNTDIYNKAEKLLRKRNIEEQYVMLLTVK